MRLFALFLFLGSLCPVVLADIIVIIEAERPPRFPEFSNDGEDPHRNCLQPDRHCQSTPAPPDEGDIQEDPGCQPGEPGCCLVEEIVIHKGRNTASSFFDGETADWFSGMAFIRPLTQLHYASEVGGLNHGYQRVEGFVEYSDVSDNVGWRRATKMVNGKLDDIRSFRGNTFTTVLFRTAVNVSCELHQMETITGGGVSVRLRPQVIAVVLDYDSSSSLGSFRDRFYKPCGVSQITLSRDIEASSTNTSQLSSRSEFGIQIGSDDLFKGSLGLHDTNTTSHSLTERTVISSGTVYTYDQNEEFEVQWYQYQDYYLVKAYYYDFKVREKYNGLIGTATIYSLRDRKVNRRPCEGPAQKKSARSTK